MDHTSSGTKPWRGDRLYVPALYTTLAILVVANVVSAANGNWIAYGFLALLAASAVSVATRMSWAHVLVQIWTFFCILGSVSLLSSSVVRGSSAARLGVEVALVALTVLCTFFLIRAKAVLISRSQN
jgi:hypothetical protein